MEEVRRVCGHGCGQLRSGHLSSVDAALGEDAEKYRRRGADACGDTDARETMLAQDILTEEETKPKQTASAMHCRHCRFHMSVASFTQKLFCHDQILQHQSYDRAVKNKSIIVDLSVAIIAG